MKAGPSLMLRGKDGIGRGRRSYWGRGGWEFQLEVVYTLIIDNKMSELSFLDRLVEDLLKSKRNNYSE
jgi:hypothetical protein